MFRSEMISQLYKVEASSSWSQVSVAHTQNQLLLFYYVFIPRGRVHHWKACLRVSHNSLKEVFLHKMWKMHKTFITLGAGGRVPHWKWKITQRWAIKGTAFELCMADDMNIFTDLKSGKKEYIWVILILHYNIWYC